MVSEDNIKRVLDFLKNKFEQEKSNHNFSFKGRYLTSKLKISSYKMTRIMLKLEEKGVIERSEWSSNNIVWRTCFGAKSG